MSGSPIAPGPAVKLSLPLEPSLNTRPEVTAKLVQTTLEICSLVKLGVLFNCFFFL